jgi:hypothetical protein
MLPWARRTAKPGGRAEIP